ncbi:unnamed protein product [Sympodiomycopsis kandeliae]
MSTTISQSDLDEKSKSATMTLVKEMDSDLPDVDESQIMSINDRVEWQSGEQVLGDRPVDTGLGVDAEKNKGNKIRREPHSVKDNRSGRVVMDDQDQVGAKAMSTMKVEKVKTKKGKGKRGSKTNSAAVQDDVAGKTGEGEELGADAMDVFDGSSDTKKGKRKYCGSSSKAGNSKKAKQNQAQDAVVAADTVQSEDTAGVSKKAKQVKAQEAVAVPDPVKAEETTAKPAKKCWLQKLPQPVGPPCANEDVQKTNAGKKKTHSKKSSDGGRKELNNDDILCAFHALLSNFQEWKPTVPSQEDIEAGTVKPQQLSPDGNHVETYYGENKYNYLEICAGILTRHRHGWGEYIRKPFPAFWNQVFKWIQSGCKSGGLEIRTETVNFKWKDVVDALGGIKELKPSWSVLAVKRGLCKDGNEMLRKKMNSVMKTLLIELERNDLEREQRKNTTQKQKER